VSGTVIVFHDVTERRRVEQACTMRDIRKDRLVADRNLASLFGISPQVAASGALTDYLALVSTELTP
jgi:hypothetical protein